MFDKMPMMGSEEGKVKAEKIFKDFLSSVTKLEELGTVGSRLLNGFQQALEFLRRPPINNASEMIKNVIRVNETKRIKSYMEAGCITIHDSIQNMSKSKSILHELKHLVEEFAGAIQTVNGSLSPSMHKFSSDQLHQQTTIDEGEKSSSSSQELEMIDCAALVGFIYSMVKQDYVMQERIVTSLNLKSSSGELESYCLMWSLRPFIDDEIVHQAWRHIC